ncbi:MAG: phosphodiesterase [Syntrophorhabdus sp. PtaB.Bin047]|nr:MAG: phosphodiesterase [Syntrophorhabdus sp. PtaB.Bin047]
MKIAVISDTHLAHPTEGLRRTMKALFSDVDIMLHAGDMTSSSVFDYLSNWDLRAVRGNMDDFDLAARLPESRVEEVEGRRIGIIHGWGSPQGLEDKVLHAFQGVDIVVFGHSHVPLNTKKGGIILFNPGSYRGGYSVPATVGVIEIAGEVTLRHLKVDEH